MRVVIDDMAKPEQRAELERRKGRDWLIVENGGGITNMRPMVLDWRGDRIARLTSWVLFDSDARRPEQPSGDAMKRYAKAAGPISSTTRWSGEPSRTT
jgi:hypothetical protein